MTENKTGKYKMVIKPSGQIMEKYVSDVDDVMRDRYLMALLPLVEQLRVVAKVNNLTLVLEFPTKKLQEQVSAHTKQ